MKELIKIIDDVFESYLEGDLEAEKREEIEKALEKTKKIITEDFKRKLKETFKDPEPINKNSVYYHGN